MLRIVSAYGIVAFHAGTVNSGLPYAGLVVFLMLSPMIDTGMNLHRRRSSIALLRTFMVPWAFWVVTYGVFNYTRGMPVLSDPSVFGLLYGSGVHLWFLPFMAGVLALLDKAKRLIPPKALFVGSIIILAALLVSFPFWRPIEIAWRPPLAQWMHALPPVIAGVVTGLATNSMQRRWISTAVIGPALAYLVLVDADWTYAFGIVVTAAIGWSRGRFTPKGLDVQAISSCMMGVYLTHMIWLAIMRPMTDHHGYVLVTAAFVSSLVSVWLARRFVPGAKIMLG